MIILICIILIYSIILIHMHNQIRNIKNNQMHHINNIHKRIKYIHVNMNISINNNNIIHNINIHYINIMTYY